MYLSIKVRKFQLVNLKLFKMVEEKHEGGGRTTPPPPPSGEIGLRSKTMSLSTDISERLTKAIGKNIDSFGVDDSVEC